MRPSIRISGVVRKVVTPPTTYKLIIGKRVQAVHDAGEFVLEARARMVSIQSHGVEIFGDAKAEHGGAQELIDRAGQGSFTLGDAPSFGQATLAISTPQIGDAVEVWGKPLDDGADGLPFQLEAHAIALGLTASLVIAREIARSPEVKQEKSLEVKRAEAV